MRRFSQLSVEDLERRAASLHRGLAGQARGLGYDPALGLWPVLSVPAQCEGLPVEP